ncbi:MAG: transketolase [Dethiosulfovibrio peptidovorans]|nr:MAG: transketolase [Dethiosulfovibrio peptidovorans]
MSLVDIATSLRRDVIRMVGNARSRYGASALSALDILVYLYERELIVSPDLPDDPDRDRLVMGKGHGCPALYAVLAHRGFFDREALWNYRRLGSLLQGRPDGGRTPGVDVSAGAPGLALGIANGLALAFRMDGRSNRVFCVIGDGELQEGVLWESAMTAAHRRLSSVTLVVDRNDNQQDGSVASIKELEPLDEKFRAFGWKVIQVDGHDFASLEHGFTVAREKRTVPCVVIARTVRGKGVSLFEGSRTLEAGLSRLETEQALEELGRSGNRG